MSLFQAREWWSVKSERIEEYTYGGLTVGNVDNDGSGQSKIVTGSLNGMLRIYLPTANEFKIEHLLLEENLERPILQVEIGYFIPNQKILGLAVLHPRRLCVYAVEGVGGNGMSANYFKIALRYEHLLGIDGEHFTSFNLIYGNFGSSSKGDRDHLCVQSLDGRLQFFEQDRFAFMQALNGCLVPNAICYVSSIDSIIAGTSDLQIECYRYQILASTSLKKKKPAGGESKEEFKSKTASSNSVVVPSEWKTNLGEIVLDIRVAKFRLDIPSQDVDILVLGEHSLFCLSCHGELLVQKRLGYHPSSCCIYTRLPPVLDDHKSMGNHSMHNLIVSNHSKVLMVYRDKQLVWSACMSVIPVAMHVAEFGGIQGMVVTLDGEGALSVNYMGTDPPSSSVVTADAKELNYEEMDEEHRQLLNVIRRSQGERKTEPRERILLRAQVPSILDAVPDTQMEDINRRKNDEDKNQLARNVQLTMRVYVTFTGNSRISNVTLSVSTPENIISNETSIVLDYVDGRSSTPLIVPIVLRPSTNVMPTSLKVTISAAYTLESGQPRVSQCEVNLPMCMACRLIPPTKSSTFKFTLETNKDPPQLTDLFEDMLTQPGWTPAWAQQVSQSGSNVLSFQYYNGVDATILVSKNGGRYRIQSSELEALWLVSHELVQRLTNLYNRQDAEEAPAKDGSGSSGKLEVFYQEPLPLADFFGAIDMHFAQRKEKMELTAAINDRAHQFRVIQKRLLVKYKDRNPAALNCLDVLLHGTYEQLVNLSHKMEQVEMQLAQASNRLSCCVHLILMLIRYRFNLDDANATMLGGFLSPQVNDKGDQGWEEITDSAMTELLRTVLGKNAGKDHPEKQQQASNAITQELTMQEDTKRLKKHITIVCDRLGKGATLQSMASPGATTGSGAPPACSNPGSTADGSSKAASFGATPAAETMTITADEKDTKADYSSKSEK